MTIYFCTILPKIEIHKNICNTISFLKTCLLLVGVVCCCYQPTPSIVSSAVLFILTLLRLSAHRRRRSRKLKSSVSFRQQAFTEISHKISWHATFHPAPGVFLYRKDIYRTFSYRTFPYRGYSYKSFSLQRLYLHRG